MSDTGSSTQVPSPGTSVMQYLNNFLSNSASLPGTLFCQIPLPVSEQINSKLPLCKDVQVAIKLYQFNNSYIIPYFF